MNKVLLHGRLTRDPMVKAVGNSNLTELSLAMNRKFKDASGSVREEATFVDCTAFGPSGETLAKYAKKGDKIVAEGRLRYEQWEDKEGNKRSKLTVVIESFDFAEKGLNKGDSDNAKNAPVDSDNAPW